MNHPLPVPPPQQPLRVLAWLALFVLIPVVAFAGYAAYRVWYPPHPIRMPPSGKCPDGYVKWPTFAEPECCPEGMQCGE